VEGKREEFGKSCVKICRILRGCLIYMYACTHTRTWLYAHAKACMTLITFWPFFVNSAGATSVSRSSNVYRLVGAAVSGLLAAVMALGSEVLYTRVRACMCMRELSRDSERAHHTKACEATQSDRLLKETRNSDHHENDSFVNFKSHLQGFPKTLHIAHNRVVLGAFIIAGNAIFSCACRVPSLHVRPCPAGCISPWREGKWDITQGRGMGAERASLLSPPPSLVKLSPPPSLVKLSPPPSLSLVQLP
jgi:hypothetical protein